MPTLTGHICLVTGATRGAGLGIASALGAQGATVYCTGRSARGAGTTDALPGTVEDAAEAVARAGGQGVATRCDHRDDAQVEALFDRVRREHGRLDVLVNNAWGGYEGSGPLSIEPFWKLSMSAWDAMFVAGLRAHLAATRLALPLMLPRKRGLVVSTVASAGGPYLGNLFYDVSKAAIARALWGLSLELRAAKARIAAVSLAPGFMRTERVLAAHANRPETLKGSESTAYVGRAVCALAADPDVLRHSGRLLEVGALAREYGFTDEDGTQPPPFRIPRDGTAEWYWKRFGDDQPPPP